MNKYLIRILIVLFIIIIYFPRVTKINNDEVENTNPVNNKIPDLELNEFNRWQDKMNIFHTKYEIRTLAPGIRGIYATEDIDKGVEIARIPLHSMIHEDSMRGNPILDKMKAKIRKNPLVAVMLYLETKNPNSKYKPYLNIFPKSLKNFPLYYDEYDKSFKDSKYL